jgi:hypothetical protein
VGITQVKVLEVREDLRKYSFFPLESFDHVADRPLRKKIEALQVRKWVDSVDVESGMGSGNAFQNIPEVRFPSGVRCQPFPLQLA